MIRRLLALAFMLISFAVTAGCVAVIVGVWLIKEPARQRTAAAYATAEHVLNIADRGAVQLHTSLTSARARLETIRTMSATEMEGGAKKKPSAVNRMVTRTVAKQLPPDIGEVRQTIATVAELSVVMNSVLEGVTTQPLTKSENFDINRLKEIENQLNLVGNSALKLNDLLEASDSMGEVGDTTSEMDQSLVRIIGLAEQFQTRAQEIRSKLGVVKKETDFWLAVGPTLVTVLCGWLIFSQIIVFARSIRLYRGRRRGEETNEGENLKRG